MLVSLLNNLFGNYLVSRHEENVFSYSGAWKNIFTALCLNSSHEHVRIDIRLALGNVLEENLVDFIDYKTITGNTQESISEYHIAYLGYFQSKTKPDKVAENFLVNKSCKIVRHHYVDLDNDEKLNDVIRKKYPEEYALLKPVNERKASGDNQEELPDFGLRTKGIFRESLPGLPLISIIIPSFNSEKVIEQAIQSAIVQTYENKEILVIDGGSKDSTAKVVKRYEDKIDWFRSEADKNIFDAINKGTYLSKGKYSVFIGSDDLLCYNSLEKIKEKILSDGEKDFLYGNGLTLTASGYIKKSICFLEGRKYSQFRIYHPALYIKKDVFNELNGFDTDHFIASDLDFELKLITENKSYSKLEDFLCIYRGGGFSSRFLWIKIKQVHTILKKYNALDTGYLLVNIRMILFTSLRKLLGNDRFNKLSSIKYIIKRTFK